MTNPHLAQQIIAAEARVEYLRHWSQSRFYRKAAESCRAELPTAEQRLADLRASAPEFDDASGCDVVETRILDTEEID
jgi:hypothetical protein